MSGCDHHDLPVVCGECGERGGHFTTFGWLPAPDHPFRPVHRIPDPEGIEGTAVVPCGEAT